MEFDPQHTSGLFWIAGMESELSELRGKKVDLVHIAEEVISHLAGPINAEVIVTLEIEAYLPEGASDHVLRAVTEDARLNSKASFSVTPKVFFSSSYVFS